jgi:hypothetical protein
MNRSFKATGLALIAICAVSTAGAQAKTFHSETQITSYEGSQVGTNVMTTTAGTIKCKKATFVGESFGIESGGSNWTVEIIELKPTYGECTAFGQAATVTTTGCRYEFNANGSLNQLWACENGGIVVHVPAGNCKVTIPNQWFLLATTEYKNEGSGASRDVLATLDATGGISYTVDGPGTICGTAGSFGGEGKYTGSVTLKGYKTITHINQVGIWVE